MSRASLLLKILNFLKITTLKRLNKRIKGAYIRGVADTKTEVLEIKYTALPIPEVLEHPDLHLSSKPLGIEPFKERIEDYLAKHKEIKLTAKQTSIVLCDQRNIRIIAGAGSGKGSVAKVYDGRADAILGARLCCKLIELIIDR